MEDMEEYPLCGRAASMPELVPLASANTQSRWPHLPPLTHTSIIS